MTLFEEPEEPTYARELWEGMGQMWLWNLGHLVVGVVTIPLLIGIYLTIGYLPVALVYGVILIVRYRRQGSIARSNGMIIALSVTILLSGACTATFLNLR